MVEQRQTALAKRFASYLLMEVDGTFKTNDWYLTLAFAVGINNNDKTCLLLALMFDPRAKNTSRSL